MRAGVVPAAASDAGGIVPPLPGPEKLARRNTGRQIEDRQLRSGITCAERGDTAGDNLVNMTPDGITITSAGDLTVTAAGVLNIVGSVVNITGGMVNIN